MALLLFSHPTSTCHDKKNNHVCAVKKKKSINWVGRSRFWVSRGCTAKAVPWAAPLPSHSCPAAFARSCAQHLPFMNKTSIWDGLFRLHLPSPLPRNKYFMQKASPAPRIVSATVTGAVGYGQAQELELGELQGLSPRVWLPLPGWKRENPRFHQLLWSFGGDQRKGEGRLKSEPRSLLHGWEVLGSLAGN